MKYTLIDLVQTILAAVDGDEVNSILDTTESQQVAMAIRTAYYDIISRSDLPELDTLFRLESSVDNTKPVLMTLPFTVVNLNWIKYDCQTIDDPYIAMKEVAPLPLKDFINRMYSLNASDSNVGSFNHEGINFLYMKDRAPSVWTSYNDHTIIFDSYDNEVDSILQKDKTLCQGRKSVEWEMTNTFIPPMDENQFSLLLNEAKSLVFAEAKQTQHPLAERNSKRGWSSIQKSKENLKLTKDFDKLPNFGRR